MASSPTANIGASNNSLRKNVITVTECILFSTCGEKGPSDATTLHFCGVKQREQQIQEKEIEHYGRMRSTGCRTFHRLQNYT